MMGDNGCVITEVRRKLAAGERRLAFLLEKLEESCGSPAALSFDREEAAFLRASFTALRYHEMTLRPETSPVLAMRELLDELDRAGLPDASLGHDALHRAVTRARRVLAMLTERSWSGSTKND